MRLEITGRQVSVSAATKRLIDTQLAKLERRLNDSAVSAQVVLSCKKATNRTEITLHARGERFLHGVGEATEWDASVRAAMAKVEQQAEKMKGKWQEGRRKRVPTSRAMAEPETLPVAKTAAPKAAKKKADRPTLPQMITAEQQAVKTMSVAEAARKMGARDGVLVFRDAETKGVAVLVRTGGLLSMVETDA